MVERHGGRSGDFHQFGAQFGIVKAVRLTTPQEYGPHGDMILAQRHDHERSLSLHPRELLLLGAPHGGHVGHNQIVWLVRVKPPHQRMRQFAPQRERALLAMETQWIDHTTHLLVDVWPQFCLTEQYDHEAILLAPQDIDDQIKRLAQGEMLNQPARRVVRKPIWSNRRRKSRTILIASVPFFSAWRSICSNCTSRSETMANGEIGGI